MRNQVKKSFFLSRFHKFYIVIVSLKTPKSYPVEIVPAHIFSLLLGTNNVSLQTVKNAKVFE